jgi:hypothetical protein
MKNLLIAVFILFLCTGCPYESQVPISNKGEVFIETLIGKWQRQDEGQNYYLVEKFDTKSYKIAEYAYNEDAETFDISFYKGHITEINDSYFFNVTQYKPNAEASASNEIMIAARPTYYLYKLEVQDDNFIMYPLSNYIKEEFEKIGTLKKFIEKNMELSFFYGEEETFIRATDH